ncbi:MAG: LTA synthase family protein [Clostridia bacterium]|nr:LTA synthase family protein [Clostridia bacterium]
MFVLIAFFVGLTIGLIDILLLKRKTGLKNSILLLLADMIGINVISMFILDSYFRFIAQITFFPINSHSAGFPILYAAFALLIGLSWLVVVAFFDKKLYFEKVEHSKRKSGVGLKVVSILLITLGAAAFTGTVWGMECFNGVDPDQLIINLTSPTEGTSEEVMAAFWSGPFLRTVTVAAVFTFFVFSKRELFFKRSEKAICVFSVRLRKIVSSILALVIFVGGIVYGVKEFQLLTLYDMYFTESTFIEDNFADPREVKMQFPEKKRNLIHIYLESMENSYASKDLGGYMDENLIAPLTELIDEGVSFSQSDKGLGGPLATKGCVWSVAAMVNMMAGVPMKVPSAKNTYGTSGSFLPGAVTIGDVLEAQGYEQSLMFGASAEFGGLNCFYEEHGNFNILDYEAAKEKGWIPQDYKEWWGYEDDKLFEFAKAEITRLDETGKPFYFVMETADTHFPDGYVGPNTPTPRDSQYANVIAYSAAEVAEFVRWIQDQPFYENTTIVLIGDHLSMDKNFFADFDESYVRTTFNLILNPADGLNDIPQERRFNRWWFNGDMFPTMLASIGVKIEGERLGVGTNLFSERATIIEENGVGTEGWKYVDKEFSYRSDYYIENILSGKEPFDNKNITTY